MTSYGRHCLATMVTLAVIRILPRQRRSAALSNNSRDSPRRRWSVDVSSKTPPRGWVTATRARQNSSYLRFQWRRTFRHAQTNAQRQLGPPTSPHCQATARRSISSTSSATTTTQQGRTSCPCTHDPPTTTYQWLKGSNPEAAPKKRDRAKKARRWKGPSDTSQI